MEPAPIRIAPIFTPRIWGMRSLAPLYPEKSDLREAIGEAWLTGADCRVASGPFAGKTLGEAWRALPASWRGTRLAATLDFPLLVKFIFPREKLSVQVHPDDTYAAAHEQASGGRGKTEMWHTVSAQAAAQVLLGLKPAVDREKFQRSLSSNAVENLLQSYPVYAGDTFFVPAGTPHAIGPGVVLCEVQEYSDLTYRLYDYGRRDANGRARQLHVERALEVIEFGKSSAGKVASVALTGRAAKKYLLAACKYFAAERWEISNRAEFALDAEHADIVVVLSGTGSFENGRAAYHPGEGWLMPASLKSLNLAPSEPTVFIRTFVPNLQELRDKLRRSGLDQAKISQILFDS